MRRVSWEGWQEFYSEANKMGDTLIIGVLLLILIIAFFLMYLMNVRIKQLETELRLVRSRMALTDDELTRLAHDIEDFKRLKI